MPGLLYEIGLFTLCHIFWALFIFGFPTMLDIGVCTLDLTTRIIDVAATMSPDLWSFGLLCILDGGLVVAAYQNLKKSGLLFETFLFIMCHIVDALVLFNIHKVVELATRTVISTLTLTPTSTTTVSIETILFCLVVLVNRNSLSNRFLKLLADAYTEGDCRTRALHKRIGHLETTGIDAFRTGKQVIENLLLDIKDEQARSAASEASWAAKIGEVRQRYEKLKAALEAERRRHEAAEDHHSADLAAERTRYENLHSRYHTLEAELNAFRNDITLPNLARRRGMTIQEYISGLEKKVGELSIERRKSMENTRALKTEIKILNAQNDSLNDQMILLEKEFDRERRGNKTTTFFRNRVDNLQRELQQSQESNAILKKCRRAEEEEVQTLRRKLGKAQRTETDLLERLEDLNQAQSKCQESLEAEIVCKNEATRAHAELLQEFTEYRVDREARVKALEEEIANLTGMANNESTIQNPDMVIEIPNEIQKLVEKSNKERDAARAQRDALTVERNTLVAERDSLRTGRNTLTIERDALTVERNFLMAERDSLRTERNTLTIERDALREKHDSLQTALEAVSLKLEEAKGRICQTQASESKTQRKLSEAQTTLQQAQDELERYKQQEPQLWGTVKEFQETLKVGDLQDLREILRVGMQNHKSMQDDSQYEKQSLQNANRVLQDESSNLQSRLDRDKLRASQLEAGANEVDIAKQRDWLEERQGLITEIGRLNEQLNQTSNEARAMAEQNQRLQKVEADAQQFKAWYMKTREANLQVFAKNKKDLSECIKQRDSYKERLDKSERDEAARIHRFGKDFENAYSWFINQSWKAMQSLAHRYHIQLPGEHAPNGVRAQFCLAIVNAAANDEALYARFNRDSRPAMRALAHRYAIKVPDDLASQGKHVQFDLDVLNAAANELHQMQEASSRQLGVDARPSWDAHQPALTTAQPPSRIGSLLSMIENSPIPPVGAGAAPPIDRNTDQSYQWSPDHIQNHQSQDTARRGPHWIPSPNKSDIRSAGQTVQAQTVSKPRTVPPAAASSGIPNEVTSSAGTNGSPLVNVPNLPGLAPPVSFDFGSTSENFSSPSSKRPFPFLAGTGKPENEYDPFQPAKDFERATKRNRFKGKASDQQSRTPVLTENQIENDNPAGMETLRTGVLTEDQTEDDGSVEMDIFRTPVSLEDQTEEDDLAGMNTYKGPPPLRTTHNQGVPQSSSPSRSQRRSPTPEDEVDYEGELPYGSSRP